MVKGIVEKTRISGISIGELINPSFLEKMTQSWKIFFCRLNLFQQFDNIKSQEVNFVNIFDTCEEEPAPMKGQKGE